MKVTAFNGIFGTTDLSSATYFFSLMGFKGIHIFSSKNFDLITMENPEGLRVDIICNDYVREHNLNGFFATRINVDDINEAMTMFDNLNGKQIMPLFKEGDSRELTAYQFTNGDIYYVVHHLKR